MYQFSDTGHPKQVVQSVLQETFCAIWYDLYSLKNVKNTHGEVILLEEKKSKLKNTELKHTLSEFWEKLSKERNVYRDPRHLGNLDRQSSFWVPEWLRDF